MTATRSPTAPIGAIDQGRSDSALHLRWLGTVGYAEAWDLQRALFEGSSDHLLLCQHPPVFTLGRNGDAANLLVEPSEVGAEVHRVDRGGDITFHGPGQLVGYPIVTLPGKRGGGMADTVAYVTSIEQLIIDVVAELGVEATRFRGRPGVWVDGPEPGRGLRKLAAVGVRVSRARTMHGFALNVDTDLGWFERIVPCGIAGKGVTSLAAEGVSTTMREVVDLVAERAAEHLTPGRRVVRQDVAWRHRSTDLAPFSRGAGPGAPVTERRPSRTDATRSAVTGSGGAISAAAGSGATASGGDGVPVRLGGRLAEAGVTGGRPVAERKPSWMRVELKTDPAFRRLRKLSRHLELSTVCEAAGCPNIYECWNEGTATYMLLGDRCTRACGFCLVDTRRPLPVDEGEPERVAQAVRELGMSYVVLTMVARDDLADGGADLVARTVEAIRADGDAGVEVLISDLAGSAEALARVCSARPQVLNHNIETVPRLQRAVRPSASYARSLALLARAREQAVTTKSGIIVGMGEEIDEVRATLIDLASVGVEIVTIGQYLRPTSNHLPLHRWLAPEEFEGLKAFGEGELGIAHVEAHPLTRSSHHAGTASASVLGAASSTPARSQAQAPASASAWASLRRALVANQIRAAMSQMPWMTAISTRPRRAQPSRARTMPIWWPRKANRCWTAMTWISRNMIGMASP
jgi:lipoic acid synthetase